MNEEQQVQQPAPEPTPIVGGGGETLYPPKDEAK